MTDFIPAGRLSAIYHGDQKIEMQTEFSKYPEPRIATTVSINGRTVHKIQKFWGKAIESLDEMREVEEFINRQHDEVTSLVNEHAGTLVQHSAKAHQTSVVQQVIEQVEEVPAIEAAFVILSDGKLQARSRISAEAEMLAVIVQNLTTLLVDISEIGNLGGCEDCVLNLGAKDALLLPFQGGYLVALTDAKVRKREVLEEIWKIMRAA
jgi:hypothetical protein